MTILVLVRNFVPAHEQIARGDWNVAAVAKNEYDLENKVVGTVAVGRIGERVLRRLKPFDCKELLYYDYQPLSPEKEKEIGCRRVENLEEMLAQCDVVTINCPLHEKTRGLFNKELISKMKKGESRSTSGEEMVMLISFQAHGSSIPLVVLSSSRRMSPTRLSPDNSVVTVVTCGSHSQHQKTTHSATHPTPPGVAAMPPFLTCLEPRSMLSSATLLVSRIFWTSTSADAATTDLRI